MFTPDGKLLLQRRVHNKAEAKKLSILGGHVDAGDGYRETAVRELLEELGLIEIESELDNEVVRIGEDGQFRNDSPSNNEFRALYAYVLSGKEYAHILEKIKYIEENRTQRTEPDFEAWIEEEQWRKTGYGEVWGYHTINLEELTDRQSPAGYVEITEWYWDGINHKVVDGQRVKDNFPKTERVSFTSDLLEPLVTGTADLRAGTPAIVPMEAVRRAAYRMLGRPTERIVHVSYQDPAHLAGGQGVAVFNIARSQVAMGYDVVWVSPCVRDEIPGEYLYMGGKLKVIKVKVKDEPILSFFASNAETQRDRELFGDKFVELIKGRYNPDETFIHLHGFIEVPRRAAELAQASYSVTSTFHMFLSPRMKGTGEGVDFIPRTIEIERAAIHANSRIIVNSISMREELLGICPDYAGELVMMPNGAEDAHFSERLAPRDETPLVSTYGRISPEKGFDIFIEAAKIITDRRKSEGLPPVNFLVFGKTDDSIQLRREYQARLRALAEGYDNIQLDMTPQGTWGEDRLKYMDRSHVGVVPSTYEPFGMVLVEYMARGVPVVSTLTYGARDMLGSRMPGRTPYGCLTGMDPRDLADAIEYLVDHPEEAMAMGRAGQEKARRQYSWGGIMRRMTAFYRSQEGTRVFDEERVRQVRERADARWQEIANPDLARQVDEKGIEAVLVDTDPNRLGGVVWFPRQVKYKVLDAPGGAEEAPGPLAPNSGNYITQYNESRGFPRGGTQDKAASKTDCIFCRALSDHSEQDLILADLEEEFGLPYNLIADSRPFFDKHMLALEKGHTGKITLRAMKDLLTIFNVIFPGRRGNIGTGNAAAHTHIHIYDTEFPIERQEKQWFAERDGARVGLITSDVNTAGFVVESKNMDKLAEEAYRIVTDIESRGWLVVIITAPNQVYIIPQKSKEIADRDDYTYPEILAAFKKNRPEGVRARYVGPVEVAGIWLCYSRGDIEAMREMYGTVDLEVYRNIIRDTEVDRGDPQLAQIIENARTYSPDKNLHRGEIDEIAETHPAIDEAAKDGRMMAVTIDQVDNLGNEDAAALADIFISNLIDDKAASEVREKLIARLSHNLFRNNVIDGFKMMRLALKDITIPVGKPLRLVIIVEKGKNPTVVYKNAENNLIAHSGLGKKTGAQVPSIYIGYNTVETALETNETRQFQDIIAHEADDIARGFHNGARVFGLYNTVMARHNAEQGNVAALEERIMSERVPYVELHLTNKCNQDCEWCSYKGTVSCTGNPEHLLFGDLDKIAALNPEEILIVGGGEATLYQDGEKGFNDAILRLRELLPDVKLRLITNGTYIPDGEWVREVSEVSISLDEPTRADYIASKRRDHFDTVWKNIRWYLEKSPIPKVRVTLLYNRVRLEKSIVLAKRIFGKIYQPVMKRLAARQITKEFGLMIFPMADDKSSEDPYVDTKLDEEERRSWRQRMERLQGEDYELWQFIVDNTNIDKKPLDDLRVPPADRCLSVSNYALIGADRKIYPCFAACEAARDMTLGDLDQSPAELLDRRKGLLRHVCPFCTRGCRPQTTFYGLRSFGILAEDFQRYAREKWDALVNDRFAATVETEGIDAALGRYDPSALT
ncbi:MAG: glycosyltransferase, partial [Candidatus Omnitrophota bacterium]